MVHVAAVSCRVHIRMQTTITTKDARKANWGQTLQAVSTRTDSPIWSLWCDHRIKISSFKSNNQNWKSEQTLARWKVLKIISPSLHPSIHPSLHPCSIHWFTAAFHRGCLTCIFALFFFYLCEETVYSSKISNLKSMGDIVWGCFLKWALCFAWYPTVLWLKHNRPSTYPDLFNSACNIHADGW